MDGEIDAALDQRLLDLLGEEALAADLLQLASCTRSPVVRMTAISAGARWGGRGQALLPLPAPAQRLPRVPMRKGPVSMTRV
jgi:hypothetical protein